jgi:hypothetical protein
MRASQVAQKMPKASGIRNSPERMGKLLDTASLSTMPAEQSDYSTQKVHYAESKFDHPAGTAVERWLA